MNIKIVQPAGLGDIFFCLKIARKYVEQGNKVYWPVIPQYRWVSEYLIYDGIVWEDVENPDLVVDLQSGGRIYPEVPIMDAKYMMADMSYHDWQDYFVFNRNYEKEEELYKSLKRPYCLICDLFASPPGTLARGIQPQTDMLKVYINYMDGYTPFDWCKVIENAEEIHFVDTCFTYLIEKLDTRATKKILYSRDGIGFYTKQLWKTSWEYIL